MKKITLLTVAAILLPWVTFSQINVRPTGRVEIGNPMTKPYDPLNVGTMILFGNSGEYAANSKLLFGDFGSQQYYGWNVFIGEYNNGTGDGDTDQLWLHGKTGLYLTARYGYTSDVIAYYDVNIGNRFNFNCDVYSSGQLLYSDGRYKQNIQEVKSPLSTLHKLEGVSYNLKNGGNVEFVKNPKTLSTFTSESHSMSEKEKRDLAVLEEFNNNKVDNRVRYGFVAQDLQKVFPELVVEDKDGFLAVDYMGLIPIIVEGMKEQQAIITSQSEKIKELELQLLPKTGLVKNTPVDATATTQHVDAYLQQSILNTLNKQTEIKYSVPGTANGLICVFDMQGKLLKQYATNNSGSLIINNSDFTPGMFLYSLVVDGLEIDTKKMVLTE